MQSKVGLASWNCSSCNRTSYVAARSLLNSTTAECVYCCTSISVSEIEENNADLKHILAILGHLAIAREMHRHRQDQVATLKKAAQMLEEAD